MLKWSNKECSIWDGANRGANILDWFHTFDAVLIMSCIMLFSLCVDDIHEALGVGIIVNGMNVRVLMYADDIVLLANSPREM